MRGRSDLVTALLARVARLHMMTILSHICVSLFLLISCVCHFFVVSMACVCWVGRPKNSPEQKICFWLNCLMFQLFVVSSIVVVSVTSTGFILSISGLNHNKTTTNIKPPQVLRLGTILQCHSKNRQHLVGARNTCRWETQELPKGR